MSVGRGNGLLTGVKFCLQGYGQHEARSVGVGGVECHRTVESAGYHLAEIQAYAVAGVVVTAVVAGGNSRQESVGNGLNALSKDIKLAAIHDGARPLITWQLIDWVIRAANTYGAAAPAIPVKDTVKTVEGGIVVNTPDRSKLRAVQTPQVFDIDLLKGALLKAQQDGAEVTDDCSAVERLGMKVKIVEGDEKNLKVTTPMDLKIAEMLLEEAK